MLPATSFQLKDGRSGQVRAAVAGDAQAITDLVNLVGAEEKFILRERSTWTVEEEQRTLSAADGKASAFFAAEVEGRLVGMLALARGPWTKNAHVADLTISCLPAFRGLGVGTALMGQGIAWARAVGIRKITLCVFASNEGAIALYRRMGFSEEGRLQDQFLIAGRFVDDVLMARWL
ncbi:MAG: N-acetyltransferase family protein [Thermoplasmata archaeon]